MPQNIDNSNRVAKALGENWREITKNICTTFGNYIYRL